MKKREEKDGECDEDDEWEREEVNEHDEDDDEIEDFKSIFGAVLGLPSI